MPDVTHASCKLESTGLFPDGMSLLCCGGRHKHTSKGLGEDEASSLNGSVWFEPAHVLSERGNSPRQAER